MRPFSSALSAAFRLRLAAAVVALVGVPGAGALAQSSLATATVIRNDVTHGRGAQSTPLPTGGPVFLEETVKTGANSAARLIFRDDTALAIGALASITLDPGTFGGTAAPKPVMTLIEGGFRYVSGATGRKDVEIRTNVATIGIRGTWFDLVASATTTRVTLYEGEVEVCPIQEPRRCVVLRPGQTASVTAGGPAELVTTMFSFNDVCNAAPAICGQTTRFATPGRPAAPPARNAGAAPPAPARIRLAGPLPAAAPSASLGPVAKLCGR